MATHNIEMNYLNTSSSYDVLYPKTSINNIPDWSSVIYSKDSIDDYINNINTSLETGVYYQSGQEGIPTLEEHTVNMADYNLGDTVPILEKRGNNWVLANYKVYATDENTKSLIRPIHYSYSSGFGSDRIEGIEDYFSSLISQNLAEFAELVLPESIQALLTPITITCWGIQQIDWSTSNIIKRTGEASVYTLGRGDRNDDVNYYINTLGQYIPNDNEYYWTMDFGATNTRVYCLKKNEGGTVTRELMQENESCYYIPIISVKADGSYKYYKKGSVYYPEQKYISASNLLVDNLGNNLSVNIESGNYTGTGQYGSSYPNFIKFSFDPKVLFIAPTGRGQTHVEGQSIIKGTTYSNLINFTWGDKEFSWYSTEDADYQMNVSGITYYYIAFY